MKTVQYKSLQEIKEGRYKTIESIKNGTEKYGVIITTLFSLRGQTCFRVIKNHVTIEYHIHEQK